MNLGIMSSIKRAKPDARTRARARKLRARGGIPVKKHARAIKEITRRSNGTTFQRYLMKLFGTFSNEDSCGPPSGGMWRDLRLTAQHGQSPAGAAGGFPGGGSWWLPLYSRQIMVLARWPPSRWLQDPGHQPPSTRILLRVVTRLYRGA